MTLDKAREVLATLAAIESNEAYRWELSQLVANFDLLEERKSRKAYDDLRLLCSTLSSRAHRLSMRQGLSEDARGALVAFATYDLENLALRAERKRIPGPYHARFPLGTHVRIGSRSELEAFMNTYRLHHALVREQLKFAGLRTVVTDVGYYHGGDAVYTLEGIKGFGWLDECLTDSDSPE